MDTTLSMPPADTRAFRRALGRFATGVAVISARTADDAETAITANSFNSVSLDPPLVLWSVARQALSAPLFKDACEYAVHILSERQRHVSSHFARQQPDKLAAAVHRRSPTGGLVLPGAIARFECVPHQCICAGDHWLFLARVIRFEASDDQPLVYFCGAYQALDADVRGWKQDLGDWVF